MKISEAIHELRRVKQERGDVDVYFDCPRCKAVTAPDKIEVVVEATKATLKGKE